MMLIMLAISLSVALLLCSLMFPSIWVPLTGDDFLDAHEAGLSLVSLRNPVRESGPPICMAKLIMMRHSLNQVHQKRRCPRQPACTFPAAPVRPPRNMPWRVGRAKQYYY